MALQKQQNNGNGETRTLIKRMFLSTGMLLFLLTGSFALHGFGLKLWWDQDHLKTEFVKYVETSERRFSTLKLEREQRIKDTENRFARTLDLLQAEVATLKSAELSASVKVIQANIVSINEKLAILDRRQEKQEDWQQRWMEITLSSIPNPQ